jgi:hypothetical protein
VNIYRGNYKASDKTMLSINANSVLITIVIDIIFFTPPSARKVDAFLFKSLGGLMEQINASIQRGCSN